MALERFDDRVQTRTGSIGSSLALLTRLRRVAFNSASTRAAISSGVSVLAHAPVGRAE
ncbi:hypothetical protein [Nocardia tengchongensis]